MHGETSHGAAAPQSGRRPEDPEAMIRELRRPWLWTNFLNGMLGVGLMTAPFTFGYARGAMCWSDLIAGAVILGASLLALAPRFDFIGRWSVALTGLWLQFAPLLFWAPSPAAFATDTLVGALVIAFSILVPMMPGQAHHHEMMKPGPEVPPGWSYNPSSWHQRAPLIAAGFAGWLISRYLAAYQLGYIPAAWDPFFGRSTEIVLTSHVSRAWPISDAGFGALAYTIETLMAWMGGTRRWRTMPWMVTFFGILVIPLGLVHIALVIMQPVVVGHWCTLCLAAAVVMLVMIPLTVDEVVAMGQFLARSVREGKPFWRTFWVGGTLEGEVNEDVRTPPWGAPARRWLPAMAWGVSVPVSLAAGAALGVWLMAAPSVLRFGGFVADTHHLAGALAVTVSVLAMAEPLRPGRFLNAPLGLWLLLVPWLPAAGIASPAAWNALASGAALIALSVPRGPIRERYGSWNWIVRWPEFPWAPPAFRRVRTRRGGPA